MTEKLQKNKKSRSLTRLRLWIYRMTSVKVVGEKANQVYDIVTTTALILNLLVTFANTYDNLAVRYGGLFRVIEAVTVFTFALDYFFRLITAKYLYPRTSEGKALLKYVLSFTGIIDLLSFMPYYLPFFFPAGAAVFRMFRVARILRLFRINTHYDSLNVITEVINSKKQQLLSSVFIIVILMMASSLCMYSVEHSAQTEVFANAFSGIWWSASTLLTVGYGDIYPVTAMGKFLGIIISFLGVGMVAIPTGIISAGFVEQYAYLKKTGEMMKNDDISFIRIVLDKNDGWSNKTISGLKLPGDLKILLVVRGQQHFIPAGNLKLAAGDTVVLSARTARNEKNVLNMKELFITGEHPWNGLRIMDLDISNRMFIVMIKRHEKMLLPEGRMVLLQGDRVFLYSKKQTGLSSGDTDDTGVWNAEDTYE